MIGILLHDILEFFLISKLPKINIHPATVQDHFWLFKCSRRCYWVVSCKLVRGIWDSLEMGFVQRLKDFINFPFCSNSLVYFGLKVQS